MHGSRLASHSLACGISASVSMLQPHTDTCTAFLVLSAK